MRPTAAHTRDSAARPAASTRDDMVPMSPHASRISPRPQEWEPLVSAPQWVILAHALRDAPATLGDLRVVLGELSPGVRRALLAHLMQTLASGGSPVRAVWTALAITGHEVTLRSAVTRAHFDLHQQRAATVHALYEED